MASSRRQRPPAATSLLLKITTRTAASATRQRSRLGSGIPGQRLAVREIPRSGPPDVLIDKYGISAKAIVAAVLAGQR
jgi:transketolase